MNIFQQMMSILHDPPNNNLTSYDYCVFKKIHGWSSSQFFLLMMWLFVPFEWAHACTSWKWYLISWPHVNLLHLFRVGPTHFPVHYTLFLCMYILLMWMNVYFPFPCFQFWWLWQALSFTSKSSPKTRIENKNSKNEVNFETFNFKKWNKKLLKITRFLYLVFNM